MTILEEMKRNADQMTANAKKMRRLATIQGWLAVAACVCAGVQLVLLAIRQWGSGP